MVSLLKLTFKDFQICSLESIREKYRSRRICTSRLKVPKCEIFHHFDFNDFYGIKPLQVGDLRAEIKK